MQRQSPRKILLTADPIGGVWSYAVDLMRLLAHARVEFMFAVVGGKMSAEQRSEVSALPHVMAHEHEGKLEWMDNPWQDVAASGDWLLELASSYQPDVVHLNGYCHGALPWNAPVLMVAHSCVPSWWQAVKGQPPPPTYSEYRYRVSEGLAAADVVVAPTDAMLQTLSRYYGPLRSSRVIHNSRNPRLFSPGIKQPKVLSAGRAWDGAKNIETLDLAAKTIQWPVLVAGERTHPNGGNIRLQYARPLGRLPSDQLATHLSEAAIYALPARYEPFGLSVLEAGLSGCALVLGDIPTLRELWEGAAMFVPVDDHQAMARTINELILDADQRAELGRQARRRALRYAPQSFAEGYLAAYQDCLRADPKLAAA